MCGGGGGWGVGWGGLLGKQHSLPPDYVLGPPRPFTSDNINKMHIHVLTHLNLVIVRNHTFTCCIMLISKPLINLTTLYKNENL